MADPFVFVNAFFDCFGICRRTLFGSFRKGGQHIGIACVVVSFGVCAFDRADGNTL